MADQVVTLRITTNNDGLITGVAQAGNAFGGLGAAGKAAGQQIEAGMGVARRGVQSISQQLNEAKTQLIGLAKSYAGLYGARALAGMADSWSDMTSRIRVNIGATEDAGAVMQRLASVARGTYSSLESTADSFARNAATLGALGKSTRQQLDYTEALNNALVVSGAKGQAFQQVQDALGKAMATGSLRGIELNTVLSQGTRVAQVLAKELGTTVIGLRQMGESGQITGDVLFSALTKNMKTLRAEAESMPATIGDAFTLLRNSLLETIGVFDQQHKVSESMASGLIVVADNMSTLVTVASGMAASVAAAHAAAAAGSVLQDIAQRKVAASALAEAEAHMVKIRAMQATMPNVIALTAAEERLAAAQAAATAAGVGRAGMLARVGSGLLSLAGGPIGVAVIALGALATAIYSVYRAEQERIVKFNDGIKNMENATQATIDLTKARAALAASTPKDLGEVASREADNLTLLAEKQAEYNKKRAELAGIEERIEAMRGVTGATAGDMAGMQLAVLSDGAQTARDELGKIKIGMDALRGATDQLTVEMRDRFAKFLANDLPAAAADAANALRGVWAAAKGGDLQGATGGLFGALGDVLDKAKARFLEADKAGVQAFGEIKDGAAKAAEELAKFGKTQADVARIDVAARIAKLELAHALPETIAAARADGEEWIKNAAAIDAARAASKRHAKSVRDDGAELVKSLQDQAATFGMSNIEADRYKVSMTTMSDAQRQAAFDAIDLRAAQEEISRATREEADALERLQGIAASEADRVQGMRDKLSGATAAQIAYNKAIRDAQAAYKAAGGASSAAAVKALADATEKAKEALSLGDQADEAERFANIMASLGDDIDVDPITKKMHEIEEAIKSMADPKHIDALQDALDRLNVKKAGATLERSASAVAQGLTSMQKLAGEGTEAYARMQVAIDAANIAAAIGAIVNQGMGDPYTAFARIAAMAALMAQFVGDVGAASAAGFDSGRAERQQARQGTGTVLGDASAKSESIARAVEITANATQQLVGINRGMLRALQSLQQALGAAGVSLARGAANADFPALQDNVFTLLGGADKIDNAISSFLFGGSQEVIDQGIIIAGGALQDMIDQMAIGAYQTVEEDGGLFGSDSTWDAMSGVSEAFGRQFQLVIGSIVDAVREGATALGMLPADIEAAIAQYRVEEIRISLKGLSAEDQQKELEAVFSSIFDGLAGAVVPFIEQFQQVGEGLGETLVRVATEVQITQEAFKQLGMVVNETDPERFAQIADGLVTAAGGIDDFISGLQQFVSSFASDAQQFVVAQDALTSAFSQYGLALPATRDGMYALMQSLDATTEAGREQIAMLLGLAQTADSYYSLLDKAQSDAIKQIEDAITTLSEFGIGVGAGGDKLRAISKSAIDAVKAANLLAQAAGQQGAAEWQLALIHRVAATRAAEAIAQLMSATAEMVSNFYSGNYAGDADAASSSVRGFGAAMSSAAQQASDAIRLLLGDLSPLNDQAKLQAALQALQRGEVGREDVLQIGRRLYASSQAYTDLFNRVMSMAVPTTGGSDSMSVGVEAATVAKSPEQVARERMDLAMQIAQNVATLSNAQGETFDGIASMLHLNLADIADAMGMSNDDLTSYLENLVDQENRTPDSVKEGADRIIAAMYDIAGRTPPDLYQVPQGDYSIPTGGEKSQGLSADDSAKLGEVRDLLRGILDVSREGNEAVVEAVDGVADATRDVRRSVDNGNDAAQAGLGRNLRVIV